MSWVAKHQEGEGKRGLQTGSRVWGWGAADLRQPHDARKWVREGGRVWKTVLLPVEGHWEYKWERQSGLPSTGPSLCRNLVT